eukprot:5409210-Pleurochrysis_carterae.AAC.2
MQVQRSRAGRSRTPSMQIRSSKSVVSNDACVPSAGDALPAQRRPAAPAQRGLTRESARAPERSRGRGCTRAQPSQHKARGRVKTLTLEWRRLTPEANLLSTF